MGSKFQSPVQIFLGNGVELSNGAVGDPPDAAMQLSSTKVTLGAKTNANTGLALATEVGSENAVGTDKAGANVTLKPGGSSGSGVPGTARVQRGTSGAAGSTQNPVVDAIIVPPRKAVAANNTIQGLFEVAVPAGKAVSGLISFSVFATDDTEVQVRSGLARFSAVNKAGTITSEVAVVNEAAAVSAGTQTCTWAVLAGTNKITLRFTANSSLTPTEQHITYTIQNNSEQAVTIL